MKWLIIPVIALISVPIVTLEEDYVEYIGYPTKEDVKAPESKPVKPEIISYSDTWTEHDCLSHAIFFEARSEGELGMILVSQVILNRVSSKKSYMKNTICGVVKNPKDFSWYWDGKSDVPKNFKAFKKAQNVATRAMRGEFKGVTKSLYFKVCDSPSKFFDKLVLYKRHKKHCFYLEE